MLTFLWASLRGNTVISSSDESLSPEGVRSSLLEDWLLVTVEEVSRVDDIEEVELGDDRDWSLEEGIIGCCPICYCQMLN